MPQLQWQKAAWRSGKCCFGSFLQKNFYHFIDYKQSVNSTTSKTLNQRACADISVRRIDIQTIQFPTLAHQTCWTGLFIREQWLLCKRSTTKAQSRWYRQKGINSSWFLFRSRAMIKNDETRPRSLSQVSELPVIDYESDFRDVWKAITALRSILETVGRWNQRMMNGVINENRRAIDKDCTSGRKGFSCS